MAVNGLGLLTKMVVVEGEIEKELILNFGVKLVERWAS
jgi:hypothetical protein